MEMENNIDKISGMSLNIEKKNIEKIKKLFPEAVEEGKINFDMLRAILGDEVDDSREKYQFTWNGKAKSIKLAQTPSSATLRPYKEKSKNWDTTENLYIEGDNLEVLKQLQKTYYGKIKMIYIDPPYNTGNDFIYHDDFKSGSEFYKNQTNQNLASNPETNGRFHTDWLNMMYPRLTLAKNLLSKEGVLFISIDDNEIDNILKICSEIFGKENYAATFPWRKRTAKSDVPFGISQDFEWIICYAKSNDFLASIIGNGRKYFQTDDFPNQPWRFHDLTKQTTATERPNSFFTMVNPKNGERFPANPNRTWAITEETFKQYYFGNRIIFPGDYDFLKIKNPVLRYWKKDDIAKAGDRFGKIAVSTKLPDEVGMSQDGTKEIVSLFGNKCFSFPKPISLIKYLLKTSTNNDDIILDFFSGSATTAHAVMKLNSEDNGNRKFIMVQLPELCDEKSEAYKAGYKNICEIGEERIRRAGEQIKSDWEKEHTQETLLSDEEEFTTDIGFKVFKLDSSNLNEWDSSLKLDEEELSARLREVFKDDRSKEDILYEIMLKYGVFDRQVEEIEVNGKTMYLVGKRYMIVCLDKDVTDEDINNIGKLSPRTVIFNEMGFKDDNAKANAVYNLEHAGVEDIKCI